MPFYQFQVMWPFPCKLSSFFHSQEELIKPAEFLDWQIFRVKQTELRPKLNTNYTIALSGKFIGHGSQVEDPLGIPLSSCLIHRFIIYKKLKVFMLCYKACRMSDSICANGSFLKDVMILLTQALVLHAWSSKQNQQKVLCLLISPNFIIAVNIYLISSSKPSPLTPST